MIEEKRRRERCEKGVRDVRKGRWMRKERCEGERREEFMRENPRTNKK